MSQHGNLSGMGHHVLDEPDKASLYFEMVREIVERYKDDERIIMWNIYNEVGNSHRGMVSMPNLKKIFEIVRKIDPIQPLTCETFNLSEIEIEELPEVEKYALEQSDIISYHNYGTYETNINIIKKLKRLGRPILCTEWLARCLDNNVQEMFPLFYLEKIGCYNWGVVAGKNQTYEPWNSVWENYDENPDLKWDFTKWFHDLYRPNHRPYDPKEIEIIKRYCVLADQEYDLYKDLSN